MKHRKLRIAWSVAWGIAAVLLLSLWVRSYWRLDTLSHQGQRILTTIESLRGEIEFSQAEEIDPHGTARSKPLFDIRSSDLLPERSSAVTAFSITRGPYDGDRAVSIPDWSVMLGLSVLASLAWLSLRRFTLRTLLIATTLVAVGLGVMVCLR